MQEKSPKAAEYKHRILPWTKIRLIYKTYLKHMLQRIQTVYLLLAIALAVLTFFVPVFRLTESEEAWITVTSLSATAIGMSTQPSWPYGMFFIALLLIVVSGYSIVKYKNRRSQMRLIRTAILLDVLYIVVCVLHYSAMVGLGNLSFGFTIGTPLPLLIGCLLWLAHKGVKHDDDLVKAADRIR